MRADRTYCTIFEVNQQINDAIDRAKRKCSSDGPWYDCNTSSTTLKTAMILGGKTDCLDFTLYMYGWNEGVASIHRVAVVFPRGKSVVECGKNVDCWIWNGGWQTGPAGNGTRY